MDGSLRPVPRLKEHRKRRGLTQEELATLSGVGRRTIARHEIEPEMRLRREARQKLARALKVKPAALELAQLGGGTDGADREAEATDQGRAAARTE